VNWGRGVWKMSLQCGHTQEGKHPVNEEPSVAEAIEVENSLDNSHTIIYMRYVLPVEGNLEEQADKGESD
jgi:hypothetical protein